eukprot:6182678-Pleurochrysis_carterae.AAC.2
MVPLPPRHVPSASAMARGVRGSLASELARAWMIGIIAADDDEGGGELEGDGDGSDGCGESLANCADEPEPSDAAHQHREAAEEEQRRPLHAREHRVQVAVRVEERHGDGGERRDPRQVELEERGEAKGRDDQHEHRPDHAQQRRVLDRVARAHRRNLELKVGSSVQHLVRAALLLVVRVGVSFGISINRASKIGISIAISMGCAVSSIRPTTYAALPATVAHNGRDLSRVRKLGATAAPAPPGGSSPRRAWPVHARRLVVRRQEPRRPAAQAATQCPLKIGERGDDAREHDGHNVHRELGESDAVELRADHHVWRVANERGGAANV